MTLVAVGDLLFAVSIGMSILLGGPSEWKFQLGQYFSVAGVAGLFVLLCFFALPFVISARWALRRASAGGNTTPHAATSEEQQTNSKEDGRGMNGFHYSEGRV